MGHIAHFMFIYHNCHSCTFHYKDCSKSSFHPNCEFSAIMGEDYELQVYEKETNSLFFFFTF